MKYLVAVLILVLFCTVALAQTQQPQEQKQQVIRLIKLKYADPTMIAYLFGGNVLYSPQYGQQGNFGQGNRGNRQGNSRNRGLTRGGVSW